MLAPQKIVALSAEAIENNAQIVIKIKPKSHKNGLAAIANAFSCAFIISARGKFQIVTREIDI